MKVLLAVDSINTLDTLINEVSARSWPSGTEARVLSIINDGDVPLKVWVSVVNPMIYSFEELGVTGDQNTDYARRAIGKAVQVLSDAPVEISAEVIAGNAARQIVARAKHWGADLIVLGTNERRGLGHWLFGSTTATVAKRAHCSVRVIREKDVSLAGNSLQELFSFSSGTAESANELQASRKAA